MDPESGHRKQKWISVRKELGLNKPANKDQADELLIKLLRERQLGTYIEPSNITLKEYLQQWLEHKKTQVKEKTWEPYESTIKNHINPEIGDIMLSKLKPYEVQKLLDRKLKNGRKDKQEGGLSRRSVRYIYTTLNQALGQAVKWEKVTRNICEAVTPPSNQKPRIEYWLKEEVETFLNEVKAHRLYPFYLLALTTGMRRGELLGLRWKDINLEGHTLTVNQTMITTNRGNVFQESTKTDNSYRTLDISPKAASVLDKHKKAQKKELFSLGKKQNDDSLVLLSAKGTPYNTRNIARHMEKAIEKINKERESPLKRISIHALRHSYATMMLMDYQEDVKTLSERLGHADIRITLDLYAHVIPKKQKEAARKTDDLIK